MGQWVQWNSVNTDTSGPQKSGHHNSVAILMGSLNKKMTDWVLFRPKLSGRYYELAVLLIEGVVIKQGSTVWFYEISNWTAEWLTSQVDGLRSIAFTFERGWVSFLGHFLLGLSIQSWTLMYHFYRKVRIAEVISVEHF